jgi:hypothetical protein
LLTAEANVAQRWSNGFVIQNGGFPSIFLHWTQWAYFWLERLPQLLKLSVTLEESLVAGVVSPAATAELGALARIQGDL